MCYLCDEYGDPEVGGGIWYLNPNNYGRNMYKLRAPGEELSGARGMPGGPTVKDLINAIEKDDTEEYKEVEKIIQQNTHSQVVTLEEADRVLELSSCIGLLACACRQRTRAVDERSESEYTCLGMGVGMLKWERWPERYKGGVKFLNIDEAKEWNHKMDKRGFVHILMLYGAPFIGGLCQCDYPDCGAIRTAIEFSIGALKGHYVADVDYDICNGCGNCIQRCQFGALKFEVTTGKASIDQFKCFGCGLCQTVCPREAIKLIDRRTMPALAEVWR